MKRLSLKEIIKAVDGSLYFGSEKKTIDKISTDSRDVGEGYLFFALTGDRFDGHDFVDQVIDRGCDALVVSKKEAIPSKSTACYILVNDTLKAYQNLAKYYRGLISPITIGITGSVGKTSLKDMVNVISLDHYNTVCSFENENNHIGVPKTIFRMEENTEVLILEMGMSNKGEISLLADIGRPSIACITNVGLSHIENFTDQEEICHAKMEITDYFSDDDTLVVMGDDPLLARAVGNVSYKILMAGTSDKNDFIAEDTKYLDDTHITFLIDYDKGIERFTLPIAGLYNSTTAALAAAIMSELDISVTNCMHSLTKLRMTPHRLQLLEHGGLKIIDDTYNASPASVAAAMEYLSVLSGNRKIAVLADMKELGNLSVELHGETGKRVAADNVDFLFTVGELGREIGESAAEQMGREKVYSFNDKDACFRELKKTVRKGDCILVKGSHSMEMGEIVDSLMGIELQRQ